MKYLKINLLTILKRNLNSCPIKYEFKALATISLMYKKVNYLSLSNEIIIKC